MRAAEGGGVESDIRAGPGMKLCPRAGLRKKDSAPSTAAATPGTSVAFHANPQPRAYPCPLRDLREAHLLLPHSASVTTLHVQSFTKTRPLT